MIWWWWFGWQKKGTRVQQGHMQGNTMAEIANFCPKIMRHLFLCTEQVALPVILKYSKFVLKYDWHEYLPGNVMHLFSCVLTFHHMRQLYKKLFVHKLIKNVVYNNYVILFFNIYNHCIEFFLKEVLSLICMKENIMQSSSFLINYSNVIECKTKFVEQRINLQSSVSN